MEDGYEYERSVGDEEFKEEEVWAVVREGKDESPRGRRYRDFSASSSSAAKRLPSSSKMIPKSNANPQSSGRAQRHSAPLAIPDWSKIYKQNVSSAGHGFRSNLDEDLRINGSDDDDEEDEDKVPPHEWIAKKMARSQISSFSVCEGAGRTLKGRDLSKVRNAVLTRTGFLE